MKTRKVICPDCEYTESNGLCESCRMKRDADTKHTPTPIKADLAVIPNDGMVIELTANNGAETVGYATSEENAAFIVRAVNSHEALLEHLRQIVLNPHVALDPLFQNAYRKAIAKAEGK